MNLSFSFLPEVGEIFNSLLSLLDTTTINLFVNNILVKKILYYYSYVYSFILRTFFPVNNIYIIPFLFIIIYIAVIICIYKTIRLIFYLFILSVFFLYFYEKILS